MRYPNTNKYPEMFFSGGSKMKQKVMLTMVVLCLLAAGSANAALGQWVMDEGSGATAADSSGNGADLTLSYGAGNWVSGDPTYGTGFSFGYTQRLSAAYPVGGFAFDMSKDFTFSATIQTVNDGAIMSRLDGEAMNPGGKQLLVYQGKLYFDCSFVNGLLGTTLVNDGLAHDIAVEFDALDATGTTAIVSIYVDGVLDAQSSDWWGMSSDFSGYSDALDFHIGARENLTSPFGGIIGNVQIVPEPATMVLLGLGGMLIRRKRS
jgi:hypothetical protein